MRLFLRALANLFGSMSGTLKCKHKAAHIAAFQFGRGTAMFAGILFALLARWVAMTQKRIAISV